MCCLMAVHSKKKKKKLKIKPFQIITIFLFQYGVQNQTVVPPSSYFSFRVNLEKWKALLIIEI